jgi:ornithine decarboxylase
MSEPKVLFCSAIISELPNLFFSKQRLLNQVSLWRRYLPYVTPHYAVKSNNDPEILRWLHEAKVRFDCASPNEIRQALEVGSVPEGIIYANPCKSRNDVRAAAASGVRTTVIDSPEEVEKLAEVNWPGTALIRLKVADSGSAQPFSRKFGAPLKWVPDILKALQAAKIPHSGWSFHVGSLCKEPEQYLAAINTCAEADAMADQPAEIVDIGGGFLPDEESFADAARQICKGRNLFGARTQWIAEPGRFMSMPAVTLETQVIGVKRRHDSSGFIYTLDDSVYGSFSNIPFDGQKPTFTLMGPEARFSARTKVNATLFGHTCDSADCIAEDIVLPELRVGDYLEVQNMGAYTIVSASKFNGFPMPIRFYMR